MEDDRERGSYLPRFAAAAAASAALFALAGWLLDLEVLRALLPGRVAMNPATAVAFLCGAGALGLLDPRVRRARGASILALAMVAFGLLKLATFLGGPDLGFDRVLFSRKLAAETDLPNRMAPNTALCFTLLGASLWLLARAQRAGLAQLLALMAGLLAFFAVLGYAYGLVDLNRVSTHIPMALNTALAFVALALGALAVRPRQGPVAIVTSPGAGGYLARRLLPVAIAVPAILGGLRLWGERAGLYGLETGVLLMAVMTILLVSGLVWGTAWAIERADRKRQAAENEVQHRSDRIRDLYDHAPCGYHSLDENGLFVEINETELDWLGYERAEVVGRMRFVDVMTPSSREVFARSFPRFKESGEIRDLEFELVRKDGSTLPVSLSATAVYDESGDYVRSRSTMFDISARRALEEAQRHLAAIVDSSADAIISKSLDGTILSWNGGAEILYGYTAGEMVGKPISLLAPPDRPDEVAALMERIRSGERVQHFETMRMAKDGREVPVSLTISPIADAAGRVIGASAIAHDITVRKRAERAVQELNRELEAFSYSVSHDLRAPLRAVVGFSQALMEDHGERLDEDGRRLVERIVAGGRRMGRLIDDLLSFSRLSRAQLRRQPVDLSALAREVERGLREAEPGREAKIMVAEGLSAQGDPALLRVVLENLIGNAWKFTAKNERARIEIGVAPAFNGDRPTFFVRDDGAGFDMEYADKLFAPFQRLHPTDEFDGTGIGLATVHRIIQRHGGRIWAEGAVGKGATFHFTLEGD